MEQDAEGRLFGPINGGKRLLVHKHGHLDGVRGCVDEHAHLVALLSTEFPTGRTRSSGNAWPPGDSRTTRSRVFGPLRPSAAADRRLASVSAGTWRCRARWPGIPLSWGLETRC